MNNQNIIIYEYPELFHILEELSVKFNFNIINITNYEILIVQLKDLSNYLIVTKKKIPNINDQIIFKDFPIKISKFIERLNIEFLKKNFNDQSQVNIGLYKIDLNSREMVFKEIILKLTEKEANIIIYLSKSNKPIKINELQSKVWGYHSKLETHTVETHIYRLRKKIMDTFADDNFISSEKNGYQII